MSTVLLALKGAHHTCVTLNAGAVRRIRDFCAARGIRLDDVRFEIGGSQDVLPHLSSEPLDLVLIDGGHGFPVPFVDWLYTAGRLRLGGFLIVDDIQLWTGHVLKQFLEEEPEWRLVEEHPRRTAVFIREREGEVAKEWCFQPYVLHHDPYPDRRGTVGRGLRMLARGDLRTFGRRLTELGRRR